MHAPLPASPLAPLTEPQAKALRYILGRLLADGYPPTLREIAEGCGLSGKSQANRMTSALAELGYLAVEHGCTRGIRVLRDEHGRPVVHRWNVVTDLAEVPYEQEVAHA